MAGRARLSSARHNRNQTARSVWSAWSLLPLSNRATHPTAGASSTHSIRFATHDRPCHPSVQFAPYPPKICAKKQDFRLYYSARRVVAWVYRGALNNIAKSLSFHRAAELLRFAKREVSRGHEDK